MVAQPTYALLTGGPGVAHRKRHVWRVVNKAKTKEFHAHFFGKFQITLCRCVVVTDGTKKIRKIKARRVGAEMAVKNVQIKLPWSASNGIAVVPAACRCMTVKAKRIATARLIFIPPTTMSICCLSFANTLIQQKQKHKLIFRLKFNLQRSQKYRVCYNFAVTLGWLTGWLTCCLCWFNILQSRVCCIVTLLYYYTFSVGN